MNKLLFKIIGVDNILVLLGQWLSDTIKNEDSHKAKQIIVIVRRLNLLIDEFLKKFDENRV